MKPWMKTTFLALTVLAIFLAIFIAIENNRECCLCSNLGHSLCLFDLKTGEFMELNFDGPTDTYVSGSDATESNVDTFSFLRFGNITGIKRTIPGVIELEVPTKDIAIRPALCRNCQKLIPQGYEGQYILAYLSNNDIKVVFPSNTEEKLNVPGYTITVTSNAGAHHITIIKG